MRVNLWRLGREPEDAVAVAILAAVFVVMLGSVVFRYLLNDSLIWAEEMARFGLIAITFVGTGTGFRRDSHIRLDLADRMPASTGRVLRVVVLSISLAVVGFLAVQAVGIMPVLANSRSAAMEMPMGWLYGVVAAGLAGGVFRILIGIVAELRR